jgi:hypothetical protein
MEPLDQATIDAAARAMYVADYPEVPYAGSAFDMGLQINVNDRVIVSYRRRAVAAINAYRTLQVKA